MAGARTLYRKIQLVLDYAKEGKHSDKSTLVDYILKRRPTNFVYYWRDRESDEVKNDYSKESVDRTVTICVNLNLLSTERLSLSKRGVSATDPTRFPSVIGKSVCAYLETKGIFLVSLTEAIGQILRANPPRPPTAEEIWVHLARQEAIDRHDFRQMLSLLGQCQVLLATQKRIYLPFPISN